MALRVSSVSASTLPRPVWRVNALSARVTPAVTALPMITALEPGTVVILTAPPYEGATYTATSPFLNLRGSGNTRQFQAPPTIAQGSYDVTWLITRAGEASLTVTQRVQVLPATVRVMVGGQEVPAYWSDGLDAIFPE